MPDLLRVNPVRARLKGDVSGIVWTLYKTPQGWQRLDGINFDDDELIIEEKDT